MDADEMTDAKRGAEDAAKELALQIKFPDTGKDLYAIQIRDLIANALTQYADAQLLEARKEWLKEQRCKDCGCSYEACCCSPMRELKARNEALEEAAKVCDAVGEVDNQAVVWMLADRIRALKSGGKATL